MSKGKGKKGKIRKGKTYFTDYDPEYWYPEVNVLSMAEDHTIEDLEVSKVIVDTGATESVAGVRAMARVLDAHQIPTTLTSTIVRDSGSEMENISGLSPRSASQRSPSAS